MIFLQMNSWLKGHIQEEEKEDFWRHGGAQTKCEWKGEVKLPEEGNESVQEGELKLDFGLRKGSFLGGRWI